MAIRVEHQGHPGAVGLAGYATGLGKAQQRQQKYALDLYRDERRMQQRQQEHLAGMKYRAGLEKFRAGERAARDERMHEWDVERAGRRREHELGMAERERAWDVEDVERAREAAMEAARIEAEGDRYESVMEGLRPGGGLELDPDTKRELEKKQRALREAIRDHEAMEKYPEFTGERSAEAIERREQEIADIEDDIRSLRLRGARPAEAPTVKERAIESVGEEAYQELLEAGRRPQLMQDGSLEWIELPDKAAESASANRDAVLDELDDVLEYKVDGVNKYDPNDPEDYRKALAEAEKNVRQRQKVQEEFFGEGKETGEGVSPRPSSVEPGRPTDYAPPFEVPEGVMDSLTQEPSPRLDPASEELAPHVTAETRDEAGNVVGRQYELPRGQASDQKPIPIEARVSDLEQRFQAHPEKAQIASEAARLQARNGNKPISQWSSEDADRFKELINKLKQG